MFQHPTLLQSPPVSRADGARTLTLAPAAVRSEVVLITDGLSQTGQGLAMGLASLGMDVALVYAPEQSSEARALGEALLASGRRALLLVADSAPDKVLELAIARARELLGRLDLVIDNGGLCRGASSVAGIEVRGLRG